MLAKVLAEKAEASQTVHNDFCAEIGKHKTDKTKYRDFEFIPKMPINPNDKPILGKCEWERIEKVYEQPTNFDFKNTEIRRGNLKDDALIAVLSVLMNDKEKIMSWFQAPLDVQAGIICVNIPYHGKIAPICIDTKMPRSEGKPILSKPLRPGFPWSACIEKALAKLLGSFSAVEKLTVKEILYHFFDYSSRTILSPCVNDRLLEEVSESIKKDHVSFITVEKTKESEEAGLAPGSTYILQSVTRNKSLYTLLFNPGGKRKFISTFEERIDKWKQDARFPKVKDDYFVFRASAIQKYTHSLIDAYPSPKSSISNQIAAKVEEGSTFCQKQYALKSDKFANINFIVEATDSTVHDITILEDGRLKFRNSTRDTIGFFTIRTDPEKGYVIQISSDKPVEIKMSLGSDSTFTITEEELKQNPLQKVGTGILITGKTDGRTPNPPSNVACLPQWCIKLSEPTKLTFRIINKTICDACHYFFLAATEGERLRTKGTLFYDEHQIEGNKDALEWNVELNDVSKNFVFGCYRQISSLNTSFDFEILGEKPFELNMFPEFDSTMSSCMFEDKIPNGKNDGRSPKAGFPGVARLHQWLLNVPQDAKIFIEFEHDEGKHCLAIQEGSQRINHFGFANNEFFESLTSYDTFDFDAKAGKYAFCVIRELGKQPSEFKVKLHSTAEITCKAMSPLNPDKCHVYSRDIRFQEGEGGSFFPFETTAIPEKQYYLVVPEPVNLIGNIETNSSQDEGTYCIYIEENDGKLIKEINTTHGSEHAICNKDAKEWFSFPVACQAGVGTVLTFVVTKKESTKRSSVAVRFFAHRTLTILKAEEDLTEEAKTGEIEKARSTNPADAAKTFSPQVKDGEITKSTKTLPDANAQNTQQNQSTCCLLI